MTWTIKKVTEILKRALAFLIIGSNYLLVIWVIAATVSETCSCRMKGTKMMTMMMRRRMRMEERVMIFLWRRRGRYFCRFNLGYPVTIWDGIKSTQLRLVIFNTASVSGSFMRLHVWSQCSCRVITTIAYRTLERFHVVVCLHVDFEVIRTWKSWLAMGASIPFITSMEFYVTVTWPLMFKKPVTKLAPEALLILWRHVS